VIGFFVEGKPVPKQSFRMANGHGYTPDHVIAWHNTVNGVAHNVMNEGGHEMYTGRICVELTFLLPTRRRVDLDNLSKNVLDALNDVCYKDDAQISCLILYKEYSKEFPGVRIKIKEAYEKVPEETKRTDRVVYEKKPGGDRPVPQWDES
jgi:Holliday junction resolvase RusA-like endonuclease